MQKRFVCFAVLGHLLYINIVHLFHLTFAYLSCLKCVDFYGGVVWTTPSKVPDSTLGSFLEGLGDQIGNQQWKMRWLFAIQGNCPTHYAISLTPKCVDFDSII